MDKSCEGLDSGRADGCLGHAGYPDLRNTIVYFLGAGVLHRLEVLPQGAETIHVLSGMYTKTFGPWSYWLFSFGAFCILFSTVLSGIGAGSRSFPDLIVTFGFIDRQNLALRKKWITG